MVRYDDRRLPAMADFPRLGRVCRLGLATRGGSGLTADDVTHAIDRGVNYLNWCGQPDGMGEAVRRLGERRREVAIAVQLEARCAEDARRGVGGTAGGSPSRSDGCQRR